MAIESTHLKLTSLRIYSLGIHNHDFNHLTFILILQKGSTRCSAKNCLLKQITGSRSVLAGSKHYLVLHSTHSDQTHFLQYSGGALNCNDFSIRFLISAVKHPRGDSPSKAFCSSVRDFEAQITNPPLSLYYLHMRHYFQSFLIRWQALAQNTDTQAVDLQSTRQNNTSDAAEM